ncbi:AI-2E family transporter [Actinomadura parmotrematis]|uniref:AI-2E family transporter n=1 Tax=Actinomadura parmotrematis TaxID=2864039 RepID=UPI0027E276B8|nr:AI-2E family transporter [Actinomadura parmotrematis]
MADETPRNEQATPPGDGARPVPDPAPDPAPDVVEEGLTSDDEAASVPAGEPVPDVPGAGGGARPGDVAPDAVEDADAAGDAAVRTRVKGAKGARVARARIPSARNARARLADAKAARSEAIRARPGGPGALVPRPAEPEEPAEPVPDPAHDVEQRKLEAGADHRFPFGRPGLPLGRAHPFVFGFTAALGVITAWLLVKAAVSAKSVLIMIVVALFLAIGLNPAVERLKRLGLSRGWAVAAVFFGVLLFLTGFVASLIPPLAEQVADLSKNLPDYINQLRTNPRIARWDQHYHLLQQAQDKINDSKFQQDAARYALDVGKQALTGTFQTLTVLILTLYFLGSLPQIKTFFYQLAPRSRRARVALLGDEILERIGGYVAGQFTIAFIAGVTSYIFLEILGVPYALALALIVAVTDLIPLVGATIGAAVVCLVAFLTGTAEGIAAIVFYVVYQQVENYLVYPRVMKRTVDVQPAVTVVAALIGGTLLGVVGALLAIPTAAAISLIIREVLVPRQESL